MRKEQMHGELRLEASWRGDGGRASSWQIGCAWSVDSSFGDSTHLNEFSAIQRERLARLGVLPT
jgi:hypothetical protein